MGTLTEIEAAADALSSEQKQALLLFLASRLRTKGRLPEPRQFSAGRQIKSWISEDEADMQRFHGGE
jgi:hypothetical protein